MSQRPYEKLVEALRETNGWTYGDSGHWECPMCDGGLITTAKVPPMTHHTEDCLVLLALEAAPPPMPKLTPLPDIGSGTYFFCQWVEFNRPALEYYYAQQEQPMQSPDNTNTAPTHADIDALKADLIARINQADRDHRALIDHQRERIDGFCGSIERLELEIVRMGGIITGTKDYVDEQIRMFVEAISRNEENLCRLQLNTKDNAQRIAALESRPNADTPTTGAAKPKCDKCGDTKIISQGDDTHGYMRIIGQRLCPCVKVGDTVSAEVYNLLPPGSRVTQVPEINPDEYYFERCKDGWTLVDPFRDDEKVGALGMYPRRILRIGPATVTMCADGKPLAKEVHIADDAKPNKAEEIAEEFYKRCRDDGALCSTRTLLILRETLRKHNIGHTPTLAEKLADPDVRRLAEVVKASQNHANYGFVTRYALRQIVDALPPDLRKAVEGCR